MPYMNDVEILKQLKSGQLEKIYLLYGPEKHLIEKTVKIIRSKTVRIYEGFNYTLLNGDSCTVEEIETAVETLPVMAERKCVLVRNLNIEKLNAGEFGRIKEIISNSPEFCVLIFSMLNIEINLKKNAKIKTVADIISKEGVVSEFTYKSRTELQRIVCETVKKRGTEINRDDAGYLIDICGFGLRELSTEIEKLCAYSGNRRIEREAIDALVAKKMDASVFDMAKSVLNNHPGRSIAILDELFYQKEEPVAILGALSMSFIDIYRAKCAIVSGKGLNDITGSFNYKGKEFRIKNAMKEAGKFSEKRLMKCLNILLKADIKLKNLNADKRLILEEAVISMICE